MVGLRLPDSLSMTWLPTMSPLGALEPERHPRGWMGHFIGWVAAARAHRVILLVMSIWLLNAFDLTLTILAHQQGVLHEENPVARGMLTQGTLPIMLYKVGLVLVGSYPLLRFRAVRITELAALVVLVVYAMLAVRWSVCYELYTLAHSADVNPTEIEAISGILSQ